jgi:hypothetical protein
LLFIRFVPGGVQLPFFLIIRIVPPLAHRQQLIADDQNPGITGDRLSIANGGNKSSGILEINSSIVW